MKNVITIFLVVTSLGLGSISYGQEQRIIGAAGEFTQAAGNTVSWTIGEVVIETFQVTANHLTQGFHQSDLYVVSIEDYGDLDIQVYPNPARESVNISSDVETQMSVYNSQGKLIEVRDINDNLTTMDVSHLSRGTYMLVFEANNAIAKKMKIVIL